MCLDVSVCRAPAAHWCMVRGLDFIDRAWSYRFEYCLGPGRD